MLISLGNLCTFVLEIARIILIISHKPTKYSQRTWAILSYICRNWGTLEVVLTRRLWYLDIQRYFITKYQNIDYIRLYFHDVDIKIINVIIVTFCSIWEICFVVNFPSSVKITFWIIGYIQGQILHVYLKRLFFFFFHSSFFLSFPYWNKSYCIFNITRADVSGVAD